MIELIIFLAPACISMLIHNWLLKKEYKGKEYLLTYGGYVCVINYINFLVLFLTKDEFFVLSENFEKPAFDFKLFTIAFILSIVLPFIVGIISKNVTLKADFVENKNENSKKRR